jgi:glycosyltransferase involved in cell wall biosynthesis
MRLLSYLNISNPDDLSADSGVTFQRSVSRAFLAAGDSYAVIGCASAARLFADDMTTVYYPIDAATSKYGARYYFNWPAVLAAIRDFQPEVLFINQIELCANVRALLAHVGLGRLPIVGYCHYTPTNKNSLDDSDAMEPDASLADAGLGECVQLACVQGVVAADVVLVQSTYARDVLLRLMKRYRITTRTPVCVAPPPVDPDFTTSYPPQPPRSRRVIYNHRLYSHYGTRTFVDFAQELRRRVAFDLVICDPMPNRSAERDRMDDSVSTLRRYIRDSQIGTIHPGSNRQQYRSLLDDARLGFSSFQRGCVWSMSLGDMMGLGIPVMAPRTGAFPEMVPPQLLFSTLDDAMSMAERLLVDDDVWREASAQSLNAVRPHTAMAFRDAFTVSLREVASLQ